MGQLLRSVPLKNPHPHFTRYKISRSARPQILILPEPKSTDILSRTVLELSQRIVQMQVSLFSSINFIILSALTVFLLVRNYKNYRIHPTKHKHSRYYYPA